MTVMDETLTIEVCNSHDAVAPAADKAETWLRDFHPSNEAMYLVLLSIEELITNCIKYGYDDSDQHTILIKLAVNHENVAVTVVDDGHPFNPLELSPPDLSQATADRPVGGLGIFMLRGLADDMRYERRGQTNNLTVIKRIC